MSVSQSNGGTTFKFVALDGGAPQKRKQVAQACESCRKRKKRCHHADPDPRYSVAALNNVHHSPVSTSPSTTSQAAPTDPPANFVGHQFPRSNRVEEEQPHTETSLATLDPIERIDHSTEPIGTAGESTEVQVYTLSSFIFTSKISRVVVHCGSSLFKARPIMYSCVLSSARGQQCTPQSFPS